MKRIFISLGSSIILSLPILVLAQFSGGSGGYLGSMIVYITGLLNSLVILLVSLSVVWFIWNVIKYAMSSEEDGKEKAKSQMIWGIIAITVTVSIWGIVAILRNTFGLNTNIGVPSSIDNMIPGVVSGNKANINNNPYVEDPGSADNTYGY